MPTSISYAGYAPSQQPYEVAGQPWAMPAVTAPGQIGQYQGLGNWGTDPFGFSGGSQLTPWTQPLPDLGKFGGGVATPDLKPWQYQDFGYSFNAPGGYSAERIATPERFTYMNREASPAFTAPTEAEMQADPAYRAAMTSGTDAIQRSAAAAGNLRGGGTLKGLMDFGQRLGTQTYDNIYGKRRSEYEMADAQRRDLYATNRGNTAENYDRNQRNAFEVAQANEGNRLNAYQAASDVALRGGELGYNIATGTYDRNQANAKLAWDSQQEIARAAAAAANAGNDRDYQRAMQQYGLAYDIFNNNQDRQWNRLTSMAQFGAGASGQQSQNAGQHGLTMADLYMGGGNAQAAGTIGSANAWTNGIGNMVNTGMDMYAMNRYGSGMPGTPMPRPRW